jgi:tetratricopeptide (TPR) repeat protein
MFYCNKNTELFNSKEILNNIEGTDADNGHIFWRTKDKKNTYEARIGRLGVLKNLCEDKSLWDQARILNLDTKGKETNPANCSQQPVEAITVKVFDKEISAFPLLCDEDKKDLERAKEYASKGLFDYAILELTKKLNELPDEPQSLCLLAENYIQKYDYDMAGRILKKAVSLYPRFCWAYRVMGNLCLKTNNKDEAFIYFDKAIKFAADNLEIGYVLFDISRYFVSENKKEAIKHLKKAIEMHPKNELYNKLLKELISENINC